MQKKAYEIRKIKYRAHFLYCIVDSDTQRMIEEPTEYLKYLMNRHESPNTLRGIAHGIKYYLNYLSEEGLDINSVMGMRYDEQFDHFVGFLNWVKSGNHTEREKLPSNKTCNSYLQHVFGFFLYIERTHEVRGGIKVLEEGSLSYGGHGGVRLSRGIHRFAGYLRKEQSRGKSVYESQIKTLIDGTDSVRDKLLLLLLAETGFRIGELLGLRYAKDIDFEKKAVSVRSRTDNENEARAKNSEERSGSISDSAMDLLKIYISENRKRIKKSTYLFLSEDTDTPLTYEAVYALFTRLHKKTGIKATAHMFRHYFANERRKAGWSIEMISKALGHKSIKTTEAYLDIETEELAEMMDGFFDTHAALYDIKKLI